MEKSGQDFRVFSERYGHRSVRDSVQYEWLDEETRNRLWNVLYAFLPEGEHDSFGVIRHSSESRVFAYRVWDQYLKKPVDTVPSYYDDFVRRIRDVVLDKSPSSWYRILDLLEILMHFWRERLPESYAQLEDEINAVLLEEAVAYRVVDGQFVPITDEVELESIEEAVSSSPDPVAIHLSKALQLLSDREKPDYENSVKESISAIEALVRTTLGNKETLGKLIDQLGLHPYLAEAFKKLYHYTSDEEGVRHSFFSGDQKVGFDEAKLMLVLCSGFVNYVRAKQAAVQQGNEGGADPGP